VGFFPLSLQRGNSCTGRSQFPSLNPLWVRSGATEGSGACRGWRSASEHESITIYRGSGQVTCMINNIKRAVYDEQIISRDVIVRRYLWLISWYICNVASCSEQYVFPVWVLIGIVWIEE